MEERFCEKILGTGTDGSMRIAVAISGGVDSATALNLLKCAGHDLFALFMKNWEEKDDDGHCLSKKDFEDAQRVCQIVNVPLYGIDLSREYWENVFTHFLREIKLGYTPNPDILCNREIKFNALLKRAKALGADLLATGHYCQTEGGALLKGGDAGKDQSYFLYTMKKQLLKQVMFPIGHMQKKHVREIAKEAKLPIFSKRDSTGICFIGKRNFRQFLQRYIPIEKGPIETIEGKEIGTHDGIFYYTIGQRRGIGIGGEGAAYFVVDKNLKRNALVVAQGANHPALFASGLIATDISWVDVPPAFPLFCHAKIRYRQTEQPCIVEQRGDRDLHVIFEKQQRAVTPRQSIVFYRGTLCLGGAIIVRSLSAHATP